MKSLLNILIMCALFIRFDSATAQNPENIFQTKVGNSEVILLSDGQKTGNKKILLDASPEILEKYIPDGTFPNSCNAFLIKMNGKNILIDSGTGSELLNNLAQIGVRPEDINTILLTHMHGDHIGGLVKNDKAVFPNVTEIYIAQREYDYWHPNTGSKLAQAVFSLYKNKIKLFQPNSLKSELTPLISGIFAIAAYGHTPGHTMFLLESGNQKMMIWGDLTHAMAIQIPHPEIAVTYDVDPVMATKSRIETLRYVSENNIPIAGMHIYFPGMGFIKANASNEYSFTVMK